MPSAAKFKVLLEHGDDLDDYGLDDSDNPFASPTPPPESASKKRKEPDSGLGIEEEVSVQKRVAGSSWNPQAEKTSFRPQTQRKGPRDASRLLSFYQLWLDDLFPKARFLDALAMVEKAGHKKALVSARSEWINEGRPKASNDDDDELDIGAVAITEDSQVTQSGIPAQRTQKTPERDDIPDDDDDLYGATPRGPAQTTNALRPAPSNDAPDDDDLEALMAEAESMDSRQAPTATTKQNSASGARHLDEEDDLDALIAEAEVQDRSGGHSAEKSGGNTTLNEKGHDFADEEEAMQEMEGLW
ncbi:hypothetical protein THARTR1_07016 [Trichoderma harzianum]|uniref:Chromosome segregation in meiosis protein 3 domain-containing protein n=1 Tax=Trichoderma harzianum TaxID=5544 RepID=A0A2K0U3Q4_TRIHA|nr:hypothetical protein THARTR1_07016 [Trichoderma harzianum]